MVNKLYHKAYKFNLVWWKRKFDPYSKYETHHIYGRTGIMLCCPIFWTLAKHGHQDDWKWVGDLKEAFRPLYHLVKKNEMLGSGCYEQIRGECSLCYFFKEKQC